MYIFSCLNRLSIFNSQQTHYYYIEYVYTYHCTCFLEKKVKNTCCSNKSICYQSRVSVLRNIEHNRFVFVCKQVFIWKKFGFFFNSKCFVFN